MYLFSRSSDIHNGVSCHVETVVLMENSRKSLSILRFSGYRAIGISRTKRSAVTYPRANQFKKCESPVALIDVTMLSCRVRCRGSCGCETDVRENRMEMIV